MKLLSRNPDKPKKQLETTIGKIIYGFLLFAPLLSILVTCMYVTFNKNAYESYSQRNELAEKEGIIQETDLLINNLTIQCVYSGINETNQNYYYSYIYGCNELYVDFELPNNINAFRFMDQQRLRVYKNYNFIDDTYDERVDYANFQPNRVTFESNGQYKQTTSSVFQYRYTLFVTYFEQGTLDNAFEYSTTKVENSNLYNWAKNTGTYEVLHNTTQLLGIENTFIPMLMAYWLLISVIYFIYDIALMLIMVVHRKIHELQESI